MNSPANNLFVSSANNSVLPTSGSSYVLIIGIACVAVLGAVFLAYRSWSGSPWFGDRFMADFHVWDWLPGLNTQVALSESGAIQQVQNPTATPAAPPTVSTSTRSDAKGSARIPEHWCFVGEDLAGRWCVKVPSAAACSAERYFESRSACELTPASPLPLGIQKDGGARADPLSASKVK